MGGGCLVVLYILGALLLLIIGVLLIRVGVYISFGQELLVKVKIGPVSKQILPKSEKPKKPKKPKNAKKPEEQNQSENKKPDKKEGKGKKKLDLTFEDIRSAVPALFDSLERGLRKTRKRMKIHPMTVSVTLGGDDPTKVAEMYGWGCTAMWTIMPQLEQLIRIPDPHIHLDVDYNALKTRAEGELGLSLLVRDGIGIGASFGIPLLKWYLSARKNRAARDRAAAKKDIKQVEHKGE